jgi:FMN reductase
MASIVAVLGSVTPSGRMSRALQGALERARAAGHAAELIDLANVKLGFADGRPLDQLGDDTEATVAKLAAADAVILASPVYRASLSGSLKNFLDLVPLETLNGKAVGIVAMGATLHHYLGVDSHLRDILTWFAANTAPTSVYLSNADFVEGLPSGHAAGELDALIATLAALHFALGGKALGPRPLAAGKP